MKAVCESIKYLSLRVYIVKSKCFLTGLIQHFCPGYLQVQMYTHFLTSLIKCTVMFNCQLNINNIRRSDFGKCLTIKNCDRTYLNQGSKLIVY